MWIEGDLWVHAHGTALRWPFEGVAIPFSLHPDYDRRPRDHTGSADLAGRCRLTSARGLDALRAITAGGELHPALRTFATPMERRSFCNILADALNSGLDNCFDKA